MIGSFGSALGYYAFAFLMVVWMVVKIARSSPLLAVITFFFWPASLIALVRSWGDPEHDVRIPFFGACAALMLSVFMVQRGAEKGLVEFAAYLEPEDLALLAESDPALHAEVLRAREAYFAGYEDSEDDWYVEDDSLPPGEARVVFDMGGAQRSRGQRPSEPRSDSPRSYRPEGGDGRLPEPARPARPIDPLVDLAQTAAALSYRYGGVELEGVGARLELPSRFRFVPANRLHKLARLRALPMEPGTLGWISHETVDLGQPSTWVLELRLLDSGHLPESDSGEGLDDSLVALAGAPLLDASGRTLGSGGFAPRWDVERRLLTWSWDDPEGYSEQRAVLPLREGALVFVVRRVQPDQREFALRATRLLAASVRLTAQAQWRPSRPQGASPANVNLLQWVQGREPALLQRATPRA